VVEVTSEDKDYPVEGAFGSGDRPGWRAAAPGSQSIRLVFDQPQRLRCISLVFEENEAARTQEFVLQWSPDGNGSSVKEIVRQQWNFGPPNSIREVEEYRVELSSVAVLELIIKPNISGGAARASLKNLRLSLWWFVLLGLFLPANVMTMKYLAGATGLEPATSCAQGRRNISWKSFLFNRIFENKRVITKFGSGTMYWNVAPHA
jgi:hypothetical protein